jgi:uncharacterized metal-binding protein YceD (DUF177 family)
MTPEFSRIWRLDALGIDRQIDIEADAAERAALATRFALQSLGSLSATATFHPVATGIEAKGRMKAKAIQSCVVTGEPVPAIIDLPFTIRFIAPAAAPETEELELDVEDCDVMEHDGSGIDLGEAIAQSLGLALDPYPRAPSADTRIKEIGILSEEEAGPFGALAALKEKLKKD